MSITVETAKAHENDPAVLCCRFEAGTVIEPSNLEDPAIFPDLIDSGLLEIGEDALTIGEVLGAKLLKTSDALTPLTNALVEGAKSKASAAEAAPAAEEVAEVAEAVAAPAAAASFAPVSGSAGNVRINIGKGKNITLDIPLSVAAQMGVAPAAVATAAAAAPAPAAAAPAAAPVAEAHGEKVIRTLKRKHFKIDKVEMADETKIEGTTLYIRKGLAEESAALQDLVVSVDRKSVV